jgi:hypothetical protein
MLEDVLVRHLGRSAKGRSVIWACAFPNFVGAHKAAKITMGLPVCHLASDEIPKLLTALQMSSSEGRLLPRSPSFIHCLARRKRK